MNLIIRQETPGDYATIRRLVQEAFRTAKVSDGDEQEYVNKLRSSAGYIPELALVLADGPELVGHIMLTRFAITTPCGAFEALLLAPVCVLKEYRNRGVGSEFIRHALGLAKESGFKAVFLVGDPAYYNRFGFEPAVSYGITNTDNIPEQYVMALELEDGALKNHTGTIPSFY